MTTATSTVMSFPAHDEKTARGIADSLAELLDEDDTVVAAFERAPGWSVEVYFAHPPDETALRDTIADIVGEAAARALTFDTVAPRDWVSASLAGLAPVFAGRFIVHGAHDRSRVAVNSLAIEIEAALAFGTGHHGTTRGCLLALDMRLKSHTPTRVLDIGTGTGVLAIAAARARRRGVLASDIDPVAVDVAKANATLNRVAPRVRFVHAPGLSAGIFKSRGPFDLVFANILLPPLKRLAKPMTALLAPGACVILSGLLREHANTALAAYRAHGLVLRRRIPLDEWVTLVLEKPRASHPRPEIVGKLQRG